MEHIRNITTDILLSLVTCGLYNVYWQYKQIEAVNEIIAEERYSFIKWFLLSLITCGLYHIYHEYRMSEDLARALGEEPSAAGLTAAVLSFFALSIIVDAIHQSKINQYYHHKGL